MKWGGLPYGGAQAEGLVEQRLLSSVHLSEDIEALVQSRRGRVTLRLYRLSSRCSVWSRVPPTRGNFSESRSTEIASPPERKQRSGDEREGL